MRQHRDRMAAFWAHLAEVQGRIDRAQRVIAEAHQEAKAVQEELQEQRRIQAEEHRKRRLLK